MSFWLLDENIEGITKHAEVLASDLLVCPRRHAVALTLASRFMRETARV